MPASLPQAWRGLLSRRDLLRAGSVGVASTFLPWSSAAAAKSAGSAKSVILLWMAGGVTHIDSFDPKPGAPVEIRGSLSSIQTALTGVRFGEVMPNMARAANLFALVRSFTSGNDDHFHSQARALSGRLVGPSQITTEPNVGSLVSHVLGPRGGLPGYIAVPGTTRPGPPPKNMFTAGWLGREHEPFPTGGKAKNEDFTAKVKEESEEEFNQQALGLPPDMSANRLESRRSLREQLDASLRELEKSGLTDTMRRQYQGAFEMLLAPPVRRAFELGRESAALRERYGLTKIGQRCLLARRLVEAGARFVMVDYGYDPEFGNLWDNHNAPVQNHPKLCDMVKLPYHLAGTDRAFAALLTDLQTRGLLGSTLVVFLTEFGRTPKFNKEGGRDHWGNAGSVFLAGGGVRGGQVIGSTDKQGAHVASVPVTPADVAATVYTALGLSPEMMVRDRQDRPIALCPDGKVIPGLL
jgi:hypothetical protein